MRSYSVDNGPRGSIMTQKGEHTWDLFIEYHRCPECGNIIESREGYTYRLGARYKDVVCSRCNHQFTVKKEEILTFGPLIGDPQPPEVDWR